MPVGRVRDPPRDAHAGDRPLVLVVVVATAERRVGPDREQLRLAPRHLVGRRVRRSRRAPGRARRGRGGRPPTRAPACRPSSRRARRASAGCRARRRAPTSAATWSRMVMNGNRPPHGRPLGVGGCRPGGALAAPEHVARDDEQVVGVERRPGADQPRPPAGRRVPRPGVADDVRVTGQGVLDEHGVVPGRRERAPRLVGDGHVGQHAAPLEGEVADGGEPAVADGVTGTPDRRGRPRRGGRHDRCSSCSRLPHRAVRPGHHPGHPTARRVAAQQTGVWHWDS